MNYLIDGEYKTFLALSLLLKNPQNILHIYRIIVTARTGASGALIAQRKLRLFATLGIYHRRNKKVFASCIGKVCGACSQTYLSKKLQVFCAQKRIFLFMQYCSLQLFTLLEKLCVSVILWVCHIIVCVNVSLSIRAYEYTFEKNAPLCRCVCV